MAWPVNFFANFLDEDFTSRAAAQRGEMVAAVQAYEQERRASGSAASGDDKQRFALAWLDQHTIPRVPLNALIDHIDHLARIAGVDHVGLGSDSNGVNFLPQGVDSAADLPKITAALLERGYGADAIKKILGGNVLRVLRNVERRARDIRAHVQP